MPAVTQLTPNFLGGVSRQNDDKKLQNQVTECLNGYPDATFGLLKRPGMKHTNVLRKANGDAYAQSELAGAAWFYIDRAAAGSYIGCIKDTDIFIWTAEDGTFCTVTNTGAAYLTGTSQSDYHFRSIQDTTIITNKTVNTAMQAAGTYVANSVGTLKLLGISHDDYVVTLQGDTIKSEAQNNTKFDEMLIYDPQNINTSHHMVDKIHDHINTQHQANNPAFAGRWYLEGYATSLVIKRTNEADGIITDYSTPGGTPVAFTLSAKGGTNNVFLESFQDEVVTVDKLVLESFHGHNVKVLNSDAAEDDYYLEFSAYDGIRGPGSWVEARARDVSPGLDPASMPHELANTGATTFTFGPITWKDRLTGDDFTNPPPSFITVNDTSPVTYTGKKLNSTFFYSNRFGLLSEDNIILGVANDSYNLFTRSALTQIDSDPIDLNVSSVRPVVLSDVLPSPQGLLLFSERQQFQLYATDASVLTPSSAVIRSLSNYEMATDIAPVDVGTTTAFVSRVPGYSKLFTMQLRSVEQSPIVVDISKAVLEWLPDTIDGITTSPPNSVLMLVDRDTSYLYLYRYYNNGKEDLFQAWTKWELPGTIQSAKIINDEVFVVSQHGTEYTIGSIALDELPAGSTIATNSSFDGNPAIDMATRPVSPDSGVNTLDTLVGGTGYITATGVATTGGSGTGFTVDITADAGVITNVVVNTAGDGYLLNETITITGGNTDATVNIASLEVNPVVYDETNDITKIYVPYTPIADKEAAMLLTVPTADKGTDAEIDADPGYWAKATERTELGTGYRYFEVKGNFLEYADGIIVGYNYDFEVTLPKFYYRRNEVTTDYTAQLTISRAKFSIGRTGAIQFKLKAQGSNEWKDIQHNMEADYYSADSNPVESEKIFIVPVHQRNTNFDLKVTSNFPYPVSLVSMMWEGNYSPRFYRRT